MGDIWGAIAQYGVVPVIIGAILYLLILWQTKSSERKQRKQEAEAKLERERLTRENEIIRRQQEIDRENKLIETLKELIQEPKHTVEEQRANRRINEFIVKQLDCLIKENDAERAYMFSFHNGGKDVLGRGFLKMSITEEDVGEDIAPIMTKYQNMPRMLFPKLYEQLDEREAYNVDITEDIKKTDPFTYQFMIEHGARQAMFRAIKQEDGLMIGFIGVEYILKDCEDKKKVGKNIDKKVNRIIGALLGQQNNQGG